jgi:CheY-like chemotaxis protein
VHIVVRDTGIGISKAEIPHVFDMFAQLGGPTEGAPGGLGVGLALVRILSEMHGGSVEAASDGPGRGSRFTVHLPILPSFSGTARAGAQRDAEGCTSRRILVVDDNADIAEALSMILTLDGHDVRTVRDGAAALETIQVFAADIVLVDIGLPGMSGYELARRVRESTGRADLVIATLSGHGNEEACRRSKEAGCDSHLSKPVDLDALRNLLTARAHPADEYSHFGQTATMANGSA